MRESYQEFLKRISVFEKQNLDLGKNYFKGPTSLAYKIDKENRIKSFFGDTVVFELDEEIKDKINEIFSKIYDQASECFSERLKPNTMHMTLHDLSNSPEQSAVDAEMEENLKEIQSIVTLVKNDTIKMRTNFIFNMVNTSLVIGLVPSDENEFNKLMDIYYLVDNIKPAKYHLTPHITLSYYNINGFSVESKNKLEEVVSNLNDDNFEITLCTEKLFYQRFYSMNDYHNILKLTNE